jgi:hypothetical protein
MEKIILTVDSQYVDWGISQGVRELMQNGIDAQAKGHGLTVSYSPEKQRLEILNQGISIPKSSLLIGYSTKKGDHSQIGEFGEGYKLGCLALVKQGLSVTIQTKGERWTPSLEHHTAFDREVLCFTIAADPDALQGEYVCFTIDNLSQEAWDNCRLQFLMFDDKRKYRVIEAERVQILNGPDYKGRVYVGGILVEHILRDDYAYGYNFQPGMVGVDRDRRMADRYALASAASKAWVSLAMQSDDKFKTFEDMLKNDKTDVSEIYNLPSELSEKLLDSFIGQYGEGVIPVKSDAQATEAGHYGKRGKVFGSAYVSTLQRIESALDLYAIQFNYGKEAEEIFDLLVLSKAEQKNLLKAKQACALTGALPNRIDVARFAKKSRVLGLYHDDIVTLNRTILKDYGKTLSVLVHEIAHRNGGDGSREHLDEMTRMWVGIVTKGKQTQV